MLNDTRMTLAIAPNDLARLVEMPDIAERTLGRPYTRNHLEIVFDTENRELRDRGVTLTIRRSGRRFLQHITIDSSESGPREWENPIPTEDPVLAAIADLQIRRLVTPGEGAVLKPVQRTIVKRTTRRIGTENGDETVLNVDSGSVDTEGTVAPVCEVHLEHRAGDPGLPFALARKIADGLPVRVETRSLADRARDRLNRADPPWRKSGRLLLEPDATVEEALSHICRHCLSHLLDNESCTRYSDHPEGIHQMRVATRRLRSALRLFRRVLPVDGYARLNDEVRWLTGEMAAARDLDVFMDEIVGPVAEAFPAESSLTDLLARIHIERDAARESARAALNTPRYTTFLLAYGSWIANREWRLQPVSETSATLFRPVVELADSLLTKRYKKARKLGRVFDSLTIDERHLLRIELKKLRYATDFFSSLYRPKRVAPFISRLQTLQDGLGYLNDVAVADALVARFEALENGSSDIRHAGALVRGWHARGAADATRSLSKDVTALFDEAPFWSKPATTGETG